MLKKLSLLEYVLVKQSIAEKITNPNENLKKLKREKYMSNEDWGYFFGDQISQRRSFGYSCWHFSKLEKFLASYLKPSGR
jgi:hypothetical protein